MNELSLAFRRLWHRRGATIASMLALACSIGAAAATWSLLSAVLLHPLPIRDPDRVFVVGQSREVRGAPTVFETHVYPIVQQVRDTRAFSDVAAGGRGIGPLLVETNGRPVATSVYFCTYDWFDLLGVRMPIGRTFSLADDQRGAAPVAIISNAYWREAFDSDPEILGRVLTISGAKVTIIGVAPAGFRGLSLAGAPAIYLPLHIVADISNASTNFFAEAGRRESPTAWVTILGRLAADSTAESALQRLSVLDQRITGRTPQRHVLIPATTAALPAAARVNIAQFTRLLAITVGLLLLIGCTTVGMLLLVRTEARREEFAMCLALGASRARLARGVMLEGAIVSLAGAVIAVPVALWLFSLVRTFQLPGVPIDLLGLSLDWRVVYGSAGSALAAAVLIAIVAGAFGFSADVADALRARSGATPRLTRRRTRTLLATAEVAVALVLLSGAGLFVRSLSAALGLNERLDADRIVTGGAGLRSYDYTPVTAERFASDLATRMRTNASIRTFALTEFQGGMSSMGQLIIDGQPRQFPTMVSFAAVDDQYFTAMGLRVTAGRDFTATDTASAAPVVIVSESFGRMIAAGGDPRGHGIRDTSSRQPAPPLVREIVGVVPDVITDVTIEQPLVMYYPLAQRDRTANPQWVARASDAAPSAIREILSAVKQIDPRVTPSPMLTLREQLGRQMGPQRFGGAVLAALGIIAVLLTALGTYVLSETMSAIRQREMGIRAALGASRPQLAALVILETLRFVGIGLVAGLFLAWLGAGTIRTFLFKVQPLDPITLMSVAALILVLALAVSVKPALRAARVDLASLLRES